MIDYTKYRMNQLNSACAEFIRQESAGSFDFPYLYIVVPDIDTKVRGNPDISEILCYSYI